MGLEQHIGLYIAIGIVLYAISFLNPSAQEDFERAKRAGTRAMLGFAFGMVIGVVFWPGVLVWLGLLAAKKMRSVCEMCGRRGNGKQCEDCKAAVAREVRRDLVKMQHETQFSDDDGRPVAGVAYTVPYVPVEPPPRYFVCEMPCPRCSGHAVLYAKDYRCPGLLRVECDAGHFGDLGTESVLIPETHRRKQR